MFSLHACLKSIGSIAIKEKWRHQYFRYSRAANSVVSSLICLKFKLIQALMHVRKSGDTIFPIISLRGYFFRHSRADNSVVCGLIWLKFELILDIMHVFVTYKSKMDQINSNRENIDFLDAQWQLNSIVRLQIWLKFKLIQALMHVLINCKYQRIGS